MNYRFLIKKKHGLYSILIALNWGRGCGKKDYIPFEKCAYAELLTKKGNCLEGKDLVSTNYKLIQENLQRIKKFCTEQEFVWKYGLEALRDKVASEIIDKILAEGENKQK